MNIQFLILTTIESGDLAKCALSDREEYDEEDEEQEEDSLEEEL